jgi:hypothetical protein
MGDDSKLWKTEEANAKGIHPLMTKKVFILGYFQLILTFLFSSTWLTWTMDPPWK